MSASQVPSKEDRLKLAARIVELSDGILSIKETQHWVGLQVEAGRYRNAVALHGKRVSFYPSQGSLDRARAERLRHKRAVSKRPGAIAEYKYLFGGVSLASLREHESLFRTMVKESVDFILSRAPSREQKRGLLDRPQSDVEELLRSGKVGKAEPLKR